MKIADRRKVLRRKKNDSVNFLPCIVKAQAEGAQRPRIVDKPHKLIAAMEAKIAAVFFIPFFLSFIRIIRISVSVLLFGIFIINMLCVIIMSG